MRFKGHFINSGRAPRAGAAKAIDVIYLQREVEWLQQEADGLNVLQKAKRKGFT